MPGKTKILDYCDELTERVQKIGCANTVKVEDGKLIAYNTDGDGFLKALQDLQVETAGKAARLKVEAESSQGWKGDGMGLKYLKVHAVDKKGRVVPGFDEALSVSVEGAATLLALDNGDHYTDELFHGVDCKHMKDGFMLVILRSIRGEDGPVKVKLSSPSLKTTVDL